jgi:hypothetical protein
MSLRGHIDALTSSGYAQGWAFDAKHPLAPLTLKILLNGEEVGRGVTDRFREDLMACGYGAGWCAFRIRLSAPVGKLRNAALCLTDATSGTVLQTEHRPEFLTDSEPALTNVEQIIACDPTSLDSLDKLGGCAPVFSAFLKARGVEDFVKSAYIYVLGRPADKGGLARYSRLLRDGALDPFALLRALANSDEFTARPRSLQAPTTAAFPFHVH